MGRAAFFIRLHGCPLHCPWCDSAGTWHKDFIPQNINRMEVEDIVRAIKATPAEIVVVTGGEPAIHNMRPLLDAIREECDDIDIHLETSGAFEIQGDFDFVTVSPKRAKLPLRANLFLCSEVKLIIDSVESLDEWDEYLNKELFHVIPDKTVWLHIEWSQRENKDIMNAMSEFVKKHPRYRIGYQLHKLFKVDTLDSRSAKPAPLGGNPKLGY